MDTQHLRKILQDAEKGASKLLEPHKSAWFCEFVANKQIPESEHRGLWWRVMMRSSTCRKNVPDEEGEEMDAANPSDAAWLTCFCPECLQQPGAAGSWEPEGLAIVPVYPQYASRGKPERDTRTERVTHNYMVRLGKLPTPLPHIKCKKESSELKDVLDRHTGGGEHQPRVEPADGFVGREDAMRALARAAATSSELLVVLRGHGGGASSLVMSDGTKLTPADIKNSLMRGNFNGRVLCVFNMCHADSEGPGPFEGPHRVDAGVMWDDATFEWATVHSSEAKEKQQPAHGLAVMKALAKVIECKGLPRALNQVRLDQAWEDVRKADGASTASWKRSPQFHASRGW